MTTIEKIEQMLFRWLGGLAAAAMAVSTGLQAITDLDPVYSIVAGVIGTAVAALVAFASRPVAGVLAAMGMKRDS